jgi:hypothetical protein
MRVLKSSLLVFILFSINKMYAQPSSIYLYSGLGKSINSNRYNLVNLGTKIKIHRDGIFYLNLEYYYTEKDFYFTYYAQNDYYYSVYRKGLGFGIEYLVPLTEKLRASMGINLWYSQMNGHLHSKNQKIKELLLNQIEKEKVETGVALKIDYMFNKHNGVYFKLNSQARSNSLLPNTILSVGYLRGFF